MVFEVARFLRNCCKELRAGWHDLGKQDHGLIYVGECICEPLERKFPHIRSEVSPVPATALRVRRDMLKFKLEIRI